MTDEFNKLFTQYFASGTLGHCQDCHGDSATLYAKLQANHLLDIANGHLNLVDGQASALRWFLTGSAPAGWQPMPANGDATSPSPAHTDADAVNDLTAWSNLYVTASGCTGSLCKEGAAWVCTNLNDNVHCGGCAPCGAGQMCTNGACVANMACTPGATRACPGPDGCGGGNEACNASGQWSGTCNGAARASCPSGWSSGWLGCYVNASTSIDLTADNKPLGAVLGSTSPNLDMHGGNVVTSTLVIQYKTGGCYNNPTEIALHVDCTSKSFDLTQCRAGAPSCKTPTNYDDTGASCSYTKKKDWTPFDQGTCVRTATQTFTIAGVKPQCSW